MRIDPVDPAVRARAVAAAQGREPFDLLLTGGTLVDVGCGELRAADVGIVGPLIASVHEPGARSDRARRASTAPASFIAPGFIDMHVHFESSMLTPGGVRGGGVPARHHHRVRRSARARERRRASPGVRYTVEASRGLPVRFIVQAPSCVPPQPGLELSGADLFGPEITEMLVVGRGGRSRRGDGHARRARRRRPHGRRRRRRPRERQARVGPRGRPHRPGAPGVPRGGHDLGPRDLHRARLPREAARRA